MINTILKYISMGGNGFYIWVAYIVSLTLIFTLVFLKKKKLKKILKKIQEND